MEKAAATNLVLLTEKGQKRGLETRALNTIFTPCSRRTNCWLRLFYHGSLSFWWWNDWEKPLRIEIDLENEFERTICSISKNPFQQIVHFNTCNSILVFMNCCIDVKFFWKTNFNLEAILPCNKPTPLYLPCLVVEDEGTSSISIVNWGSHFISPSVVQHPKRWSWVWPPVPKSWSKGEGSKQTPLKDWQDMEGSLSHNWKKVGNAPVNYREMTFLAIDCFPIYCKVIAQNRPWSKAKSQYFTGKIGSLLFLLQLYEMSDNCPLVHK